MDLSRELDKLETRNDPEADGGPWHHGYAAALADVRALLDRDEAHQLAVAQGGTFGSVPTWAEYIAEKEHRAKLEPPTKPVVTLERAREMAAREAARMRKEKKK